MNNRQEDQGVRFAIGSTMLKTFSLAVTLLGALSQNAVAQTASSQSASSVTVGSVELHLNMRREEVISLLAPQFTIAADGRITPKSSLFEFQGYVTFSDTGLLTGISRDWGPSDQRAGVPTAQALYGALTTITKPSQKRFHNTTVQVCQCAVFVYSTFDSGAELKHIDIWDGTKTISVTVFSGTAFSGGSAVSVDESIGSR
jgi:hypothetical protein